MRAGCKAGVRAGVRAGGRPGGRAGVRAKMRARAARPQQGPLPGVRAIAGLQASNLAAGQQVQRVRGWPPAPSWQLNGWRGPTDMAGHHHTASSRFEFTPAHSGRRPRGWATTTPLHGRAVVCTRLPAPLALAAGLVARAWLKAWDMVSTCWAGGNACSCTAWLPNCSQSSASMLEYLSRCLGGGVVRSAV